MFRAISIFIIFLAQQLAYAACPGTLPSGIECVEPAATKQINVHSQCRNVTNNHASTQSLMVPVNTLTEWSSFYSNPPTGVPIASCSCTMDWGNLASAANGVYSTGSAVTICGSVTTLYIASGGNQLEYSKNSGAWTQIFTSATFAVVNGDTLAFRGMNACGAGFTSTQRTATVRNTNSSGTVIDTFTWWGISGVCPP